MNKNGVLFIFASFIFMVAHAQQLYITRNVQQAYKKGTRSSDGSPGPKYWQNRGRYNITVTALPPDRNIKGSEDITYINNSTDTINNPVIKLILNIHKPGSVRLFDAEADYLTSGVHIDNLVADGITINWSDPAFHSTWQNLHLPRPLLPHDSVQLHFEWHYEISLKSGREGMIDSTTFFLAY